MLTPPILDNKDASSPSVFVPSALLPHGTGHFLTCRARGGDCWPRRGSLKLRAVVGASWTTDAPFRETEEAIEAARAKGILAVEMEAAALHTFARSARVRLLF